WAEVSDSAHPPLFPALLHFAMVLGKTPLVFCAVSVGSGVAAVYLAGRVAAELGYRRGGLLPSRAVGVFFFSVARLTSAPPFLRRRALHVRPFLHARDCDGPRIPARVRRARFSPRAGDAK